jgi:hypothetical protein
MTTSRTYSNRSNARRAGLAAGIKANQLKVTVHKAGNIVRFGFCEETAEAPTACSSEPTFATDDCPVGMVKNGVRRRTGAGACASVWRYLDMHPETTVKRVREISGSLGWNVNNAVCEFYAWRKFNCISLK